MRGERDVLLKSHKINQFLFFINPNRMTFLALLRYVLHTTKFTQLSYAYRSMVCSIFIDLYDHQHNLIWEYCNPSKRNLVHFISHSHSPLWLLFPCATNSRQTLISVSMHLPILEISHKWHNAVCDHLWLASFT